MRTISMVVLVALLAIAAVTGGVVAQAQLQASVEGEAYTTELVKVSLAGLTQGVEYRVEVVGSGDALAPFTLVAYAGSISIVEAGSGYVVFTSEGGSATLYLKAGPAGSYTLRILEAGEIVAEYPVTVEPYDSRGGAEPDAAVDSGDELLVALAAALGMNEAAGAVVYQPLQAGDDGRTTIYVVSDIALTVGASFTGDFQGLNEAGTREVLVAGAYKGVFAVDARLVVDGSILSFTLLPGTEESGVKLEYLEVETVNGGSIEFTPSTGTAPVYFSLTKTSFTGEITYYLPVAPEPSPDALEALPYLQFKKASGEAVVYLEPATGEAAELVSGLSLIDSSGLTLKLESKALEQATILVLKESYSVVGSLEAKGGVALIGLAGGVLEAESIKFVLTSGAPLRDLPVSGIANSLYLLAGTGPGQVVEEDALFRVEAGSFRVEADRLAMTPNEIMDAYGTFVLVGVKLVADEAVIGYGAVKITDEGPKPESSRPASVNLIDTIVEAGYVEVGGVQFTLLQALALNAYLKGDTVVLRGASINVLGYEVSAGSLLFHPLVFNVPVNINVSNSKIDAGTVTYICGTSQAEVTLSNSTVYTETMVLRGYATARFPGSQLDAAMILGGGATPVGGAETLVDFAGARVTGYLEVAPLDYGVAVTGEAYLLDNASVKLSGARLVDPVFKAEGSTAALYIEGGEGTFKALLSDATLLLVASSPDAYGYVKSSGSSTLLLGCCVELKGLKIHVADGELEARLLGSVNAGEYFEVVVEEAGGAKAYLRGGLSGEATMVEAAVFKVTTGVMERNPEEIMDAAGEFVVEAAYIKAGDVIIGYGNVEVTNEGPRPESSRPAVVKVYRAKVEAQGTVMIGGVEVTHVKALTVSGAKIVLRGASGEYQASFTAGEVIVNPLVFNVPVKHVFKASNVEANTLKYICGTSTAEIHFYDSYVKAGEAIAAGRATLKLKGSTIAVPVFKLGGATPAGGDVNTLIITGSSVESDAFKVYSLDYPVTVVLDESVEVKAGLVEFKAGDAPLTLGGDAPAAFKAYGMDGSLELKVLGAQGSLEVYLEPGVSASKLYLEGAGSVELVVPDYTVHEAIVESLSDAKLAVKTGAGSQVRLVFPEGEYTGYIELLQGSAAQVEVQAEGATLRLSAFKAMTAATARSPAEIMQASGSLKLVGGHFIAEEAFIAGYGAVKITDEGPKPESSRPYKVEVYNATIESQGTLMIGGVMETVIVDSTLRGATVVVRGAEEALTGSSVEAGAILFHPLVFGVPVEVYIEEGSLQAGEVKYLCGTAQAIITIENSTIGSMEAPAKLYLIGVANLVFKGGEAYLSEAVAGLLTPINTGKYAHVTFIDAKIQGDSIAFKAGQKGAVFAVLGGSLQAGSISLGKAVDEVEAKPVLTVAGASVDVQSCEGAEGDVYAVNVEGVFNCQVAKLVALPGDVETVGEVYGVLAPGVKLESNNFLVKLAGGFNGPVAIYAAFALAADGTPYMILVPVNLAYQSQVYEVYYPLPDCEKPYILVDSETGAILDAAKPEDPENCVFKSHLRVKPEAAGNAEPLIAEAMQSVVEKPVTVTATETTTQTVTQVQTQTQTITATTTITQATTVTTTTTVTQTETQTNMGAVAAAAIVGLIVGAAAAFALRARS